LNSQARHFRIHTDGAARGNPGPAGAAAILYDPEGAVVAEVTRYLGVATNNVAEYSALLLGLNRARELGAESVEIVTDSELMAKQWNGEYRVKNEVLKPLYKEAKECARSIGSVEVRHVRRGGNAEADAAANRAIDEETGA
jgi:ribonuclease HI